MQSRSFWPGFKEGRLKKSVQMPSLDGFFFLFPITLEALNGRVLPHQGRAGFRIPENFSRIPGPDRSQNFLTRDPGFDC